MDHFGGSVWRVLSLEAMGSLRAQGRRSVLALLGVMIGSASIVAMMNLGHIGRTEAMTRFIQVGVDTVQLAAEGEAWIAPAAIASVLDRDPAVVEAITLSATRTLVRHERMLQPASLAAVSPQAMTMLGLMPAQGRGLALSDGCNGAAVIGSKVASELTATAGTRVYIEGYGYRVVGILAPYAAQALNPVTPDDTVFIGLDCSRRAVPKAGFSHAIIRVGEGIDPSIWGETAKQKLATLGEVITVRTPKEMIAAMNSQMNLMSAILVAIGSVSLLVGGVGVMNVMLMSVMERKREIGLRAAIGATPSEIVFIFIVEGVALSIGGGLLGALAGVGLTALGCVFLPVSFSFDPMVLVWGTGVAAVVGLVFGVHPAISASRILPVEALRAD